MSETWMWATVTGVSPLRVRLDGEVTPLPFTPETMVAGLMVDDRVRVQLHGLQAIVTGRATGTYDSGWVTLTLAAGFTATGTFAIRRIGQVVYMRGVVTPSTDWGSVNVNNTVVAAGGIPVNMRPITAGVSYQAAPGVTLPVMFRVVANSDGSFVVACDTATSAIGVHLGGVTWPVG